MHRACIEPWLTKATCWASLLAACLLTVAAAEPEAGRTNVPSRVLDWLTKQLPQPRPEAGYVSSAACVGCHADEHASWHRSYHRTMTQPATPDTVLGRFDGTTVPSGGLDYRVSTEGATLVAEMPDPDVLMYVIQGGRKLPL